MDRLLVLTTKRTMVERLRSMSLPSGPAATEVQPRIGTADLTLRAGPQKRVAAL